MCKIKRMKKKTGHRGSLAGWAPAGIGIVLLIFAGCTAVGAYPLSRAAPLPASPLVTPSPESPTTLVLPTPTHHSRHVDPQVMTATPAAASPAAPVTPTLALTGLLPTPTAQPLLPTPTPTLATSALIAPTPDGVQRNVQLPILMYHYLSTPPADADIYRKDLSVPPELFAAHLDRLLAEGYTTISFYQLLAYLTQGAALPEKPIIITFDDGYRDNYENAFPLLRERGMTATFFVVTDFLDEERPAYLTWEMAREMYAGGMSIESHGRNHASLKGQNADYLVWQVLGSLETIQHELGVRPRFVSYPAGEFDQLTIDIFKSANYWAGATTIQGATLKGDDLFRLPRVRVRNTTTADDLSRLLALDW